MTSVATNTVAIQDQHLALLKERVSAFKERRVSYLSPGSDDKSTRKWAKLPSKRYSPDKGYIVKDTMFRDDLNKWEQVQINDDTHLNAITFDVDMPSLFQYPYDDMPYCKIQNQHDSKYHLVYMLKDPFYAKSDKQRKKLEHEIKPQIKMLDIAIGADANYNHTTIKNPFNNQLFETTTSCATVDLWSFLNNNQEIITAVDTVIKDHDHDNKYLSDKHKAILEPLIAYSRKNIHLLFKDHSGELYHSTMTKFANRIKLKYDNGADFNAILQNVMAKAHELTKQYSKRQKALSEKANAIRWGDHTDQTQQKIHDGILTLYNRGTKITQKTIAEITNIQLNTIKKNKRYSTYIHTLKTKLNS